MASNGVRGEMRRTAIASFGGNGRSRREFGLNEAFAAIVFSHEKAWIPAKVDIDIYF